MSLIGRDRELYALGVLLDRLRAGVGERVVVTGPPGAGKSALLAAAAGLAAERGIRVEHIGGRAPSVPPARPHAPGDPVLLLSDAGTAEGPGPEDPGPGHPGSEAPDAGEPPGPRALLVAAREHTGDGTEVRLGGLSGAEFAALVPGLPPDAVHALWLASGGLPGPALSLSERLRGLDGDADPVAHLALVAPSRAQFLELDLGLLRLLEAAAERPLTPAVRARVLARLARELLADTTAAARRRDLADTALAMARASGDAGTVAEVLDSRLHALWDPAATTERLTTAEEIVALSRRAGDAAAECRGLFWRFVALAEEGDLAAAEVALGVYARAAEQAGHTEAPVVALARQAVLATIRGRFDEAEELADQVLVAGRKAGVSDTERLAGSVRHQLAVVRGRTEPAVAPWQTMARRLPGHFFEATAARAMLESGRDFEAGLELERLLPAVLTGTGPRWIGALADLAAVASRTGGPAAATDLYDTLLPYRGRLVVWGGANTVTGPVDDYLGRLAARLDRTEAALGHLDAAAELSRRLGALPWLARTLAARAEVLHRRGRTDDRERATEDVAQARSIAERLGMSGLLATLPPAVPPVAPAGQWRWVLDGADWRLEADEETARVPDGRGPRYLRTLLAAPGREIPALDLVAGGAGLAVPPADPLLDDAARAAYRRRLTTLEERLDAADRAGDVDAAAAVQAERGALLAELRRATGVAGRPRTHGNEAERARVGATRALWGTVRRIEAAAPLAGAHLRASLRTGRLMRYQPAPGGPGRWQV
ncbi:AAA family ATPase [Streptomyces sp. NPDC026673]|uniref:AAA family ATPase n=1 Tax=Streptomyces sp. NPDC026673 TaxID=3155724 RepID=UPI0033D608E1